MTLTDAVSKAKLGENAGFTYLYETCNKKCYYTALKFMKDSALAEDMMQEAFIKAFDKISTLEDGAKFESWLCQITARLCLNELKKNQPMLFSETETEDGADISDTFYDDRVYNNPEISLDKKETSRLINEMLKDLSEEQQICVTMFYADEMSVKDIAESLDVSENTVKSRLNYARKHIKEKVLELEKKGTKLYGLAPMPLLMLLLKKDASACEISVTCADILSKAGISAKASIGAEATLGAKSGLAAKFAAATVTQKAIAGAIAGAVVISGAVGVHNLTTNKYDVPDDYTGSELLFVDFYDTGNPVAFKNGVVLTRSGDEGFAYYFYIGYTNDYAPVEDFYNGTVFSLFDNIETTSEDYTYQLGKLYAKAYNDFVFLVGTNADGVKSSLYIVTGDNKPTSYAQDYAQDDGAVVTKALVDDLLEETDYDLSSWVDIYSAIDGYYSTEATEAYAAYEASNDELVSMIFATNESISADDFSSEEEQSQEAADTESDDDTIDTNDTNDTQAAEEPAMVSDSTDYIPINAAIYKSGSNELVISLYTEDDPTYIGSVEFAGNYLGELKYMGSNIYKAYDYDTGTDSGYTFVTMSDGTVNVFYQNNFIGNFTVSQLLIS